MTYRTAVSSSRTVRTVAATAIASSLALGVCLGDWAGPAAASTAASATGTVPVPASGSPTTGPGSSGASSVASLQVQAQELAGEIDADGRQLDQLSAAYQAAELRLSQLDGREAATRRAMARSSAAVAQARRNLRQQALLAYLTGGSPLISYIPGRPGLDPSLTTSYAEIISGSQRDAVDAYRATLAEQGRQAAQLTAETSQAAIVLAAARADAGQAQATLASRQAALAGVNGQLAIAVAAVRASQQQAEAVAVKARLASEGQLPPTGATQPSGPTTRPTTAVADPTQPAAATRAAPSAPAPVATTPYVAPTPAPTAAPATTAAPAPTAPPATSPPATSPPVTSPPPGSSGSVPPQAPGASQALAYARAQLGKPYQWGGAGPDSFDCSGLVMMAWQQGGVYFPHLAQDQYDMTARIPLSQLLPGDLVFFGTPSDVYHVGIYIGNGQMIDAPETGQDVSVQSIYWDSLLGGGRVHT